MTLRTDILNFSRQDQIGPLSPWFSESLDWLISKGTFVSVDKVAEIGAGLVQKLNNYGNQTRRTTVVLGMSGGVDSALTAALFKSAGFRVLGYTLPIHQNPAETERGIEACKALGIEHTNIDLSDLYDATLAFESKFDPALMDDTKEAKIRRGNIRARLRMVTLYNQAALNHGFVASTDNFSELAAGFWTLHGDVGDVSPIQALYKSWEVPMLAKLVGVPEATYRATPTDGLGIDAGDEAQLGASYLEWDIMFTRIAYTVSLGVTTLEGVEKALRLEDDERAKLVFKNVTYRAGLTWFKRMNPICLPVDLDAAQTSRYELLANVDKALFRPDVARTW